MIHLKECFEKVDLVCYAGMEETNSMTAPVILWYFVIIKLNSPKKVLENFIFSI